MKDLLILLMASFISYFIILGITGEVQIKYLLLSIFAGYGVVSLIRSSLK